MQNIKNTTSKYQVSLVTSSDGTARIDVLKNEVRTGVFFQDRFQPIENFFTNVNACISMYTEGEVKTLPFGPTSK